MRGRPPTPPRRGPSRSVGAQSGEGSNHVGNNTGRSISSNPVHITGNQPRQRAMSLSTPKVAFSPPKVSPGAGRGLGVGAVGAGAVGAVGAVGGINSAASMERVGEYNNVQHGSLPKVPQRGHRGPAAVSRPVAGGASAPAGRPAFKPPSGPPRGINGSPRSAPGSGSSSPVMLPARRGINTPPPVARRQAPVGEARTVGRDGSLPDVSPVRAARSLSAMGTVQHGGSPVPARRSAPGLSVSVNPPIVARSAPIVARSAVPPTPPPRSPAPQLDPFISRSAPASPRPTEAPVRTLSSSTVVPTARESTPETCSPVSSGVFRVVNVERSRTALQEENWSDVSGSQVQESKHPDEESAELKNSGETTIDVASQAVVPTVAPSLPLVKGLSSASQDGTTVVSIKQYGVIPSGPPQHASVPSNIKTVTDHEARKQQLMERLADQRAQEQLYRRQSMLNSGEEFESNNLCSTCGLPVEPGEDQVWLSGSRLHRECWTTSALSIFGESSEKVMASYAVNKQQSSQPTSARPKKDPAKFLERYRTTHAREKSFRRGWPHSSLKAAKMAKAGFVFTPTERRRDRVKCVFCLTSLHRWKSNDKPSVAHRKISPNCAFERRVAEIEAEAAFTASPVPARPHEFAGTAKDVSRPLQTSSSGNRPRAATSNRALLGLDMFSSGAADVPASRPVPPPLVTVSSSPTVSRKTMLKGKLEKDISKIVDAAGPRVFGVSLAETLVAENVTDFVPLVMRACMDYFLLHEERFDEEGLFRISPDYVDLAAAVEMFENLPLSQRNVESLETRVNSPHVVASMLKQYMRELPEPILTFQLYICFIAIWDHEVYDADETTRLQKMKSILAMLPDHNRALTVALLKFIGKVAEHSEHNKMGMANLGIVFAPSLLRSEEISLDVVSETSIVTEVCTKILEERSYLFDI